MNRANAKVFLMRLAQAVLRQAIDDLHDADAEIAEAAREFLFGEDTLPLEKWLVMVGCVDAEHYQDLLRRKLEREKRKAA